IKPSPVMEKPVELVVAPPDLPAPAKPEASPPIPTPTVPQAKPNPSPPAPAQSDVKRKGEVALTVAAIIAAIIHESRTTYYRTGHPCACPDDLTRTGQRCGARSAYSRPGGAAPLCYPQDVTQGMIEDYRRR